MEEGASIDIRGGPPWRTILLAVVGALGAAALVALIFTLGTANAARDRAIALQSKSFRVMLLTRSISGTMARSEATLGRFVISADKAIGRAYYDEWVQGRQQIDRLAQLTRDNPAQQRRIESLRLAYGARGDELSLIALNLNYGRNNQALSLYYAARDSRALNRTQRLLDALIAAEQRLLEARTEEAMETIRRSNRAAGVFAGFGVLLVAGAIALGWLTARALAQRSMAAAEAEAQRLRSEDLEAAVAAATAELHAEAAEREAAEAQLRQMQKLEAVGQLTGGIAHDFNNMLAVVSGGIELARRRAAEGASDELDRHLESAAEGANRAAALTRRLLAFARSEPLTPQATDPGQLIEGMSDLLDRTLGDTIRVVTRQGDPHWPVWVDRHGLENALLNLAVNARDAMEGRGTLTIATGGRTLAERQVGECAAGDYATIAVTDTGCGMPADVLERVFEPFFTTKPVGRGTGLGLSQIFGFVRQSGGEIAIDSTPGSGTTVTLFLPRHIGAAEASDGRGSVARLPTLRTDAEGHDILVIEDDPRVLAATLSALKELGHRPVACSDPMAAAAMVPTIPTPRLILSDVLMPGKTGPEVIAELTEVLPDAAVLFVTGFAGDAGDHAAFGGHQVLRKPFTIAGLASAIDAAIARSDGGKPARRAAG